MSTALTIKPEDKTKVMALGAAITVMFGYVGVSFARSLFPSSSPSSAPTPSASPATAATTPPPASGGGSKPLPGTAVIQEAPPLNPAKAKANADALAAQAVDGAARQHIALPNLNEDPFSPVQGNPEKFKQDGIPQKSNNPAKITPPPITLPPSVMARLNKTAASSGAVVTESGIPMLPSVPMGGTSSRPRSTAPVLPVILPDIPLILAGVIRGEVDGRGVESGAVAMIQAGDGQQFVRVGEIVEGWRVLRIGGETVTLRRANRIRVLRIGAGSGSQTAQPYLAPIPAGPPPSGYKTPSPGATPIPTAAPAALTASPMPTATPAAGTVPVELTNLTSSR